MTMLYIDEIEPGLLSENGRLAKVFDNSADVRIAQHWIVGSDSEAVVQNRVVIKNLWLWLIVSVWSTKTAGVRELKSDQQIIQRACGGVMLSDQSFVKSAEILF